MIREGDAWRFNQQGHGAAVRVVPSWTGTRQPDPARLWETELETGWGQRGASKWRHVFRIGSALPLSPE